MMGSGVTVHFPHETDMQGSMFSNVFAQIESRFNLNHPETTVHNPRARDAAISTMDKGIYAARQFLRSLFTYRNTLVPISRLPPEILARVFRLLMLEEPPFTGRQNLGWIKVTHVCQHWRQVSLNNSVLWATIPGIPKSTEWISEMLIRAKNAPLDIEFHAGARSSPEALRMVPPHLSHTRQLHLYNLSTLHSDSIREIFSWEAPALEHFELTVAAYPYAVITFPDLGGNILFNGHAPRLRELSLSRVVIPWSLVPRGQLTWLQVSCANEDVHSPGDLNQLIDLLVNCPSLENLVLHSCLPSQLTEFPHGRTIHLPNLSRLYLYGSTSRIVNMLKMLKLPSSIRLHLDCISETTSIHNDSEGLLLRVISAHFQSPIPIEFKSLTVTTPAQRYTANSIYITASTFPSTLRNRRPQNAEDDKVSEPELVLSSNMPSKPGHSTDLLKQACKMLPIANLEFVSMSATNTIEINWVELFGCCPNVTTMQAIGRGTSSLVHALTAPVVTNPGSGKEGRGQEHDIRTSNLVQQASTVAHAHAALVFPKLKFLGLTELNFSEEKQSSFIPFDVFKRGLQQRMDASGAPLKLLQISDCKISSDHMNDLQELVQDFRW